MTIYTPSYIADNATKINNCVNGNPRYYIPVYFFADAQGDFYRPKYCRKYTGKRYGAGWVFSSYSLESDISDAMKDAA